jgi:hypothetical protein
MDLLEGVTAMDDGRLSTLASHTQLVDERLVLRLGRRQVAVKIEARFADRYRIGEESGNGVSLVGPPRRFMGMQSGRIVHAIGHRRSEVGGFARASRIDARHDNAFHIDGASQQRLRVGAREL